LFIKVGSRLVYYKLCNGLGKAIFVSFGQPLFVIAYLHRIDSLTSVLNRQLALDCRMSLDYLQGYFVPEIHNPVIGRALWCCDWWL